MYPEPCRRAPEFCPRLRPQMFTHEPLGSGGAILQREQPGYRRPKLAGHNQKVAGTGPGAENGRVRELPEDRDVLGERRGAGGVSA